MEYGIFDHPLLAQYIAEIEHEIAWEDWSGDLGSVELNSTAPTGEPYITITQGGEKPEGESSPFICTSPEAAISRWSLEVMGHIQRAPKGARLYWRSKPDCIEFSILRDVRGLADARRRGFKVKAQDFDQSFYSIWSRLLISDKPILAERKKAA